MKRVSKSLLRGATPSVSRQWLRAANQVGNGARVLGRPYLRNNGSIHIGAELLLSSRPVQSHLVTLRGGQLGIGNRVQISYGAAIAAMCRITIEDDVRIGPFAVIMDGDFHNVTDRSAPGEMSPVHIGAHVTIGARVTILRGSTIGAGATLLSGCVVSGTVPPDATVAGVPARPVSQTCTAVDPQLASLVANVLGLDADPHPSDGPDQIPQWDSLGSLRLLLAIEDAFKVSLDEREFNRAHSLHRLGQIIEDARAKAA